MKRCPQCEFIYEDDQSLCDMDGVLLVFDSRTLPNLHALAPLSTPPAKTSRRNRAVPAFATVILALVLGMVYFVSTQRSARINTFAPAPTTSAAAAVTNPTPEMTPAEASQPAPAATETERPEKEEAKPVVTKPSTAAPVKKAAAKTTISVQTKPTSEQKKDESKVGSILKKTGRILKKPFKL